MIIRQPSAREDRPPIATASIAGAVCLGAGLWLAHAAMGHPVGALGDSESESMPPSSPPPVLPSSPPVLPSSSPVLPPPPPVPPPPSGTPGVSPASTRVRHGRVAYLRCDGAPQVSGPFPCPRDEALEASVWAAIDQLIACAPALAPGQADLVVEFDRSAGASAPTIATRDTFPDEAIRTDAAGVVACLSPTLSALTTTIAGDRIRVGFRFALE